MNSLNNLNIAVIRCSGGLNLGNEFINAGGTELIQKFFASSNLYYFEFYDSCIPFSYKYPSMPFTNSSRDFINQCDLIFIFGGSIISKYMASLFNYMKELKPLKILLGASLYMYDEKEMAIARQLKDVFNFIVTRDNVTYRAIDDKNKTVNGIDLAFLLDKNKICPNEKGKYHLINLDLIQHHQEEIQQLYDYFINTGKETYIIENTTIPHKELEGYVYLSYWESLYAIIANAGHVITNRIHTSVVCLKNGVSFVYKGADKGGQFGRNTLFNEFNFCLENIEYESTLLSSYSDIINNRINLFYDDFSRLTQKFN